MKKIHLMAMCYLLIVAGSSCKKDESDKPVSKTDLLTTGTWKVTAFHEDDEGDGVFERDIFPQLEACYTDNYYTFKANGQFEMNEGTAKCDDADPQADVTNWQLTQDEKNLVIDTDSYVIEELSATTLKVKQIVTGLYGEMLTLTKR